MSSNQNEEVFCSFLDVDIVGYSKKKGDVQGAIKEHLNLIVLEAIERISYEDRILNDVGDGIGICFKRSPKDAFHTAMRLLVSITEFNRSSIHPYEVRIGINFGPGTLTKDVNGNPNFVGDGINVANRIMGFADPNQITVSKIFYDMVRNLTEEFGRRFKLVDAKKDKHGEEHIIYKVLSYEEEAKPPQSRMSIAAQRFKDSERGSESEDSEDAAQPTPQIKPAEDPVSVYQEVDPPSIEDSEIRPDINGPEIFSVNEGIESPNSGSIYIAPTLNLDKV